MPRYLCAVSVREIYHLWVEADNPRAAENSLKTMPAWCIRMAGVLKDVEQNYAECIDGLDLDAYIPPQPVREAREHGPRSGRGLLRWLLLCGCRVNTVKEQINRAQVQKRKRNMSYYYHAGSQWDDQTGEVRANWSDTTCRRKDAAEREARTEFAARCEARHAAMFGPAITEGSELPSYLSAELLA